MFGKDKVDEMDQPKPAAAAAATDTRSGAAVTGGVPSIISADMKVVGNLQSGGDIQIDGTVDGDIRSRTVTVGESAHIDGSINAESVNVRGRVSGQVTAASVRLAKTANVQGDINYKTLAIEEEAVIDGQMRRIDPAKAAADANVATLKAPPAGGDAKAAGGRTGGSPSVAPSGAAPGAKPQAAGPGAPGGKPIAR